MTKNRQLITRAAAIYLTATATMTQAESPSYAQTFEKYVQPDGTITVPEDYRTRFTFLGTFSVAGDDKAGGQSDFHQVYIDPDSVEAFRRTGAYPDGAILVKELQKARAIKMTTGYVSSWKEDAGWFVMIKDTQGRYNDSGLWGDGWGWALFDAANRTKPTTKNYKTECIPCHVPVKKTDWTHVWAYPLLDAQGKFSEFKQ